MVVQNFKWPSLITGLASKFDFRESGRATFNPSNALDICTFSSRAALPITDRFNNIINDKDKGLNQQRNNIVQDDVMKLSVY